MNLEAIYAQSKKLDETVQHILNGTISNDILEIRWPLGVPPQSNPEIRHDLLIWSLLNETHQIMPNSELNAAKLSKIDQEDVKVSRWTLKDIKFKCKLKLFLLFIIQRVLSRTLIEAKKSYPELIYKELQSLYRKFDPIRGMDYQLHLLFEDSLKKLTLKSFEAVKPLGRVEIVPSPYVTESTRIVLVLPTFEHQIKETQEFINHYEKMCMEHQDNTFLMLVRSRISHCIPWPNSYSLFVFVLTRFSYMKQSHLVKLRTTYSPI